MAHYTENFNLYEKDPVADKNDKVNITTMFNDNWDKIDAGAQKKLTAGANITINGSTISATDTIYTAGTGISISANNVISNTQTSANWGNITGTLSDQTDLQTALNAKQDTLVSGTNIKTINNNPIVGSGNLDIDGLPSQSGQSGKYLTTDGSNASWATVSNSLSGLTDTNITSPSNDQILKYDSATSKWINSTNAVYLKTTYINGTSGYNIWSNGYCEQWGSYRGTHGANLNITINTSKTFSNSDYCLQVTPYSAVNNDDAEMAIMAKNSNNFRVFVGQMIGDYSTTKGFDWKCSGYLASGQY